VTTLTEQRLANGVCSVSLHSRLPAVLRYRPGRGSVLGDASPSPPTCVIFSPEHGRNIRAMEAGLEGAYAAKRDHGEMRYSVALTREGRPVISFTLLFALAGPELSLSLQDVNERDGYQLVHVDLSCMVSATSSDPRSRLVLPSHGGRRIDPARCEPGERLHRYNWVREAFSQVGVVYGAGVSVVMRLESLNDSLLSRVTRTTSGGWAGLGVRIVHRMEARRPDLQFAVHRPSRVSMTMLCTDCDDTENGWVPAARWLHARAGARPADPYAGRFIYKVFVGKPGSPAEIPFDAVLEGMRRRFHLLDGAGQLCYLVGFQHEGHDSGYPDVFACNEAAGGIVKLKEIMAAAKSYNTTVSFHDNFDDAYRQSPGWDPADIAVDSSGEPLKGGIWNGVQAFWIAVPKYVRDKALPRLRRTLAMYPVSETYHLDVLTASVFRPDYDPAGPTDRNDDFAARKALVELFRQNGLDVTTEGCGLPFLGAFSYFWDLPRPAADVYKGDEAVPLAPFIAHGIAGYGGSEADRYGIVEGLYVGAFYSKDLTCRTTEAEVLDAYYLLQVPLDLLRDKAMTDCRGKGASRTVIYDDGSTVEVDFERLTHRVTINGRIIVEDYVSFAPGPRPETWILYVSALQDMGTRMKLPRWSCPEEWRSSAGLRATALTPFGEGEPLILPVHDDGSFSLDVPVGVPFRVSPVGGK
jgi:hypothetical protein